MIFGHHDARGNLEFIADNLILLQDHFSGANTECSDCMVKHIESIRAYANEGMTLDHGYEVREFLKAALDICDNFMGIILTCMEGQEKCVIKKPEDMYKMVQEARALRREINMTLYHLAGDLLYEGEGAQEHSHSHDFTHENPHEEPLQIELTEAGLEEFTNYMRLRPDVLVSEEHTIGINPLAHPDRYFEIELQEREHADVLQIVRRDRGIMDKPAVEKWEREETAAR